MFNKRIIAFGFLLTFASNLGQTFFIALYVPQLLEAYGLSDSGFSFVYSLATLLSATLLLWTGPWVDRYAPHKVMLLAVLGLSGGGVLLSFGQDGWQVFVALLLLRQCGQGLMGHLAATTVARHFNEGRGRALSLMELGFPLGEAFLPMLAVAGIAVWGWQQTWFLVAALQLLLIAPLAWFLVKHWQVPSSELFGSDEPPVAVVQQQWSRAEVLKHPAFYALLLAVMGPPLIVTGLFFHQLAIAALVNWSAPTLAASFLAFAATHVLGTLLAGQLIDRFSARFCAHWFLWPLMLACLLLWVPQWPFGSWLYMGFIGLAIGIEAPLVISLLAERYGVQHLGAIKSVVVALMVFASAFAPILFSYLLQGSGAITVMVSLCLAYLLSTQLLLSYSLRRS